MSISIYPFVYLKVGMHNFIECFRASYNNIILNNDYSSMLPRDEVFMLENIIYDKIEQLFTE